MRIKNQIAKALIKNYLRSKFFCKVNSRKSKESRKSYFHLYLTRFRFSPIKNALNYERRRRKKTKKEPFHAVTDNPFNRLEKDIGRVTVFVTFFALQSYAVPEARQVPRLFLHKCHGSLPQILDRSP